MNYVIGKINRHIRTGKHSARPALRGPFLALFSPSPGRKKNKKSEGPMGNAEMWHHNFDWFLCRLRG